MSEKSTVEKKRTNFYISTEIFEKLKQHSKETGISQNFLLEKLLKEFFEKQSNQK